MTADERSSVASLSNTMAVLSLVGFILLPIITVYVFIAPDSSHWLMFHIDHLGAQLTGSIPLPYRLAALLWALVPTAFTMWALWSLARLFRLYARAQVFSQEALSALNHVAVALFAGVVVGIAVQAPISLVLSWPNGTDHREISLSFGSGDIGRLFIAGVVLVIAKVMREAQRVADENAKFV